VQRFEAAVYGMVEGAIGGQMKVSANEDGTIVVAYLAMLVKPDPQFVAEIAQEVTTELLRSIS
jgi:hypothetical protein